MCVRIGKTKIKICSCIKIFVHLSQDVANNVWLFLFVLKYLYQQFYCHLHFDEEQSVGICKYLTTTATEKKMYGACI